MAARGERSGTTSAGAEKLMNNQSRLATLEKELHKIKLAMDTVHAEQPGPATFEASVNAVARRRQVIPCLRAGGAAWAADVASCMQLQGRSRSQQGGSHSQWSMAQALAGTPAPAAPGGCPAAAAWPAGSMRSMGGLRQCSQVCRRTADASKQVAAQAGLACSAGRLHCTPTVVGPPMRAPAAPARSAAGGSGCCPARRVLPPAPAAAAGTWQRGGAFAGQLGPQGACAQPAPDKRRSPTASRVEQRPHAALLADPSDLAQQAPPLLHMCPRTPAPPGAAPAPPAPTL